MTPLRRLARLFQDPTSLEFVSAVLLGVWAIVLALPPATFTTTPSYATMAALAGEMVWSVTAGVLSVCGILGVLKPDNGLRTTALLGGVFFWGSVGTCISVANPAATGGWVYIALAVSCGAAHALRGR